MLSSPELPGIIQELNQLIYNKDASKYVVQGKHDPILLTVCRHSSAENLLTSVTRFIIDATTYATWLDSLGQRLYKIISQILVL